MELCGKTSFLKSGSYFVRVPYLLYYYTDKNYIQLNNFMRNPQFEGKNIDLDGNASYYSWSSEGIIKHLTINALLTKQLQNTRNLPSLEPTTESLTRYEKIERPLIDPQFIYDDRKSSTNPWYSAVLGSMSTADATANAKWLDEMPHEIAIDPIQSNATSLKAVSMYPNESEKAIPSNTHLAFNYTDKNYQAIESSLFDGSGYAYETEWKANNADRLLQDLTSAIMLLNEKKVQQLLSYGANAAPPNEDLLTLLCDTLNHWPDAPLTGSPNNIAQLLIDHGAIFNPDSQALAALQQQHGVLIREEQNRLILQQAKQYLGQTLQSHLRQDLPHSPAIIQEILNQQLIKAIMFLDVKKVEQLLIEGANPAPAHDDLITLLCDITNHLPAAIEPKIPAQIAKLLINFGAKIDIQSEATHQVLHALQQEHEIPPRTGVDQLLIQQTKDALVFELNTHLYQHHMASYAPTHQAIQQLRQYHLSCDTHRSNPRMLKLINESCRYTTELIHSLSHTLDAHHTETESVFFSLVSQCTQNFLSKQQHKANGKTMSKARYEQLFGRLKGKLASQISSYFNSRDKAERLIIQRLVKEMNAKQHYTTLPVNQIEELRHSILSQHQSVPCTITQHQLVHIAKSLKEAATQGQHKSAGQIQQLILQRPLNIVKLEKALAKYALSSYELLARGQIGTIPKALKQALITMSKLSGNTELAELATLSDQEMIVIIKQHKKQKQKRLAMTIGVGAVTAVALPIVLIGAKVALGVTALAKLHVLAGLSLKAKATIDATVAAVSAGVFNRTQQSRADLRSAAPSLFGRMQHSAKSIKAFYSKTHKKIGRSLKHLAKAFHADTSKSTAQRVRYPEHTLSTEPPLEDHRKVIVTQHPSAHSPHYDIQTTLVAKHHSSTQQEHIHLHFDQKHQLNCIRVSHGGKTLDANQFIDFLKREKKYSVALSPKLNPAFIKKMRRHAPHTA